MYILNAFSINMLPRGFCGRIAIVPITEAMARKIIPHCQPAIGHADLARLLGVPCERHTVALAAGDKALVVQYRGPRLPEGCTELPAGAELEFVIVLVGAHRPEMGE